MKKGLLIVGIVSIIVCVVFLLFAALYLYGYYHVLDGSAGLYSRLHQKTILFLIIGVIWAVIGTVCLIIRSNL